MLWKNLTLDPGYIGFFGRKRIVLEAYGIAHLVEQSSGSVFHIILPFKY